MCQQRAKLQRQFLQLDPTHYYHHSKTGIQQKIINVGQRKERCLRFLKCSCGKRDFRQSQSIASAIQQTHLHCAATIDQFSRLFHQLFALENEKKHSKIRMRPEKNARKDYFPTCNASKAYGAALRKISGAAAFAISLSNRHK